MTRNVKKSSDKPTNQQTKNNVEEMTMSKIVTDSLPWLA